MELSTLQFLQGFRASKKKAAKPATLSAQAGIITTHTGDTLDTAKALAELQGVHAPAVLALMAQCGDDSWGSCKQYPQEDWRHEVEEGNTVLGYWQWILAQAEADHVNSAKLTAE